MDSPLGVSIFANALDSLRALDVAFDSFEREFRLGKKRILVPDTAIRTIVDPDTGKHVRYFDANDEVYQAFKFENEEGDNFKDLSVELRVDEHVAAINSLLNLFAMQIGFSAGSFSFDGQSMKTATEVVSENSKTFRTKQSHEVIIEEGLIEMIDIIVDLAALYKIFPKPSKKYEVSVTFDDSIAEDKTGDLNYWTQLVTNKLATRKRAIMSVLGLTEDEAEQELLAIAEEDKQGTPEMIDFFGMNRNEEA
jgi:A118 family predicted phage portal protein